MIEEKDHKIFETIVNGGLTEVWSRKETHTLGEMNGCPNNWWLKMGKEWVPWIDKMSKRPCWEVNIKETNRTKDKWGETNISGFCILTISCNNRIVYSHRIRDIEYCLAKAQNLITDLSEHPFKFWDIDSEIGRKIYYYGKAATIVGTHLEENDVIMRSADGLPWKNIGSPESEIESEWNGEVIIHEDVLAPTIYWFRDKLTNLEVVYNQIIRDKKIKNVLPHLNSDYLWEMLRLNMYNKFMNDEVGCKDIEDYLIENKDPNPRL